MRGELILGLRAWRDASRELSGHAARLAIQYLLHAEHEPAYAMAGICLRYQDVHDQIPSLIDQLEGVEGELPQSTVAALAGWWKACDLIFSARTPAAAAFWQEIPEDEQPIIPPFPLRDETGPCGTGSEATAQLEAWLREKGGEIKGAAKDIALMLSSHMRVMAQA